MSDEYPFSTSDIVDSALELKAEFEDGTAGDAEFEEFRELLAVEDSRDREHVLHGLASIGIIDEERTEEVVDELLWYCFDQPRPVREAAAEGLVDVGRELNPTTIRPAVDTLQDRLGDSDESVREAAAFALTELEWEHPELLVPLADDCRNCLDDDNGTIREHATSLLDTISSEQPEAIELPIDDLRACLDDDRWRVRTRAASTLRSIAETHPDAIHPVVDDVLELLPADYDISGQVWMAILSTLRTLAKVYEGDAPRIVAALRGILEEKGGDGEFPPEYTWTITELATIATARPDAVVPAVEDLRSGLDNPSEVGRVHAAEALAAIGREHPEAVRPAVNELTERLEDEHPWARTEAAGALRTIDAVDPGPATEGEEICGLLLADGDESVTADAVERFEDAETAVVALVAAELRTRFEDAESADERLALASAVGTIGPVDGDVAWLLIEDLESYFEDDSPAVRAAAAEAYGTVYAAHSRLNQTDAELLGELLDDEDEAVRSAAAAALLENHSVRPEVIDHDPADLRAYVESD